MTPNFDLGAVLEVEREVLTQLPEAKSVIKVYFKEAVAQVLYQAWIEDPTDMRLLTYCFPLIQSMMVKNIFILKHSRLEEGEVFNTLCLNLLAAFPKYNATRGRIFTFCTLMLHFRIKDVCRPRNDNTDPLDDWDMPVEDDAFHLLEGFKAFLCKLAFEQGPTASRMLRAFVEILTDHKAAIEYGRSQDRIKAGIAHKTGLPRAIVDPFYTSLLTRWAYSVLD
jgi:hypothetical protein